MNRCKCWVAVFFGILLLPSVAVSADVAAEAHQKGEASASSHLVFGIN